MRKETQMGKKVETKGMEGGNRMNNNVVKYHMCAGCDHPSVPCVGKKLKSSFYSSTQILHSTSFFKN